MTKMIAGLVGVIACACSSTENSGSLPSPINGQTGSPSYICEDTECSRQAKADVASLTGPVTAPATLVSSSCHPADTGTAKIETRPTIYCRCDQSDGSFELVSHDGPDCILRGRGDVCVFDNNDYQECNPADTTSCNATCSLLQSRLIADAAATHTASVRLSQCKADRSRCDNVIQVDGKCFTNDSSGFIDNGPYDCALSNAQLLGETGNTGGGSGAGGTAFAGGAGGS
jgi:hypothetical protein